MKGLIFGLLLTVGIVAGSHDNYAASATSTKPVVAEPAPPSLQVCDDAQCDASCVSRGFDGGFCYPGCICT